MSFSKDRSLFVKFIKCKCKIAHHLNTEAKIAKDDFSAFLNTWFAKSLANALLRSVEDVILNIINDMELPYVLNKIYDHNHLDNLSQIVQRLYIDLDLLLKAEKNYQGSIKL